MEVEINVTYSKNAIAKIEDSKGNVLSQNSTNAMDTQILKNGKYYYTIIDETGYEKTISVNVNETRTITYNINGGTTAVASITAGYGEEITMPTPERKHTVSFNTGGNGTIPSTTVEIAFNGWYTEATGGEKREYTTMPKHNKTLYASWGDGYVTLPNFPNENYLGNWYLDSSLTSSIGKVGDNYLVTRNITLYAGYKSAIYAFYYSSDNSLVFNTVNEGIEGKIATKSFGDISNAHYTNGAPWDNYSLRKVIFLDVISPKYTSYWFEGQMYLSEIDPSYIRTNNVIDMQYMFYSCIHGLTSLDLSSWDVSKVTNMSYMFTSCRSLTSVNMKNWNTSRVTDMSRMFWCCEDLNSIDCTGWNVSSVTDMNMMFRMCYSLTELDLSSFRTSKVTDMSSMFSECRALTNLNISNFVTSNVTTMANMFNECRNLTQLNLKSFNTSKVTDMRSMFDECSSLTELDLSSFNTSKVTSMNSMFYKCSKLKTIYVGSYWKVASSATNIFTGCGTSTTTRK